MAPIIQKRPDSTGGFLSGIANKVTADVGRNVSSVINNQKQAAQRQAVAERQAAAKRAAQQETVNARKKAAMKAESDARTEQRRVAAAPAPVASAAPSDYSGGGGVGGISYDSGAASGGMGISSASIAPDVPATPIIPDVNSDATYQAQVAELAKAMADYQNQDGLARGQYDTNYNGSLKKLGWNGGTNAFDRNDKQGLYGQALDDNTNDFAARGMLRSGSFAEADSRLNNDFAERKTDMDTARTQFGDTQTQQLTNYQGQNSLAKQAAQREAIARIAAQYGVSLDQVPLGSV